MKHTVKFTSQANQDLEDAVEWYDSQEAGVGKKLAKEVIEKAKKIGDKPDSYSADKNGLRKTSLKIFPYFLYYVIKTPIVLILAVWHKSRKTDAVMERNMNPDL